MEGHCDIFITLLHLCHRIKHQAPGSIVLILPKMKKKKMREKMLLQWDNGLKRLILLNKCLLQCCYNLLHAVTNSLRARIKRFLQNPCLGNITTMEIYDS